MVFVNFFNFYVNRPIVTAAKKLYNTTEVLILNLLTEKEYSFSAQCESNAVAAVLVAGGSSSRMKGIDKLFADLAGKPVLAHALVAYENCPSVRSIVIASRPDAIPDVQKLCEVVADRRKRGDRADDDKSVVAIRLEKRTFDKPEQV